jgi:hypothetical protein
MWTPQIVLERITSGALLPDSMFESLDADELLSERDYSFDDDWVRTAESLQHAWERNSDASSATPAVTAVREVAFKRTFSASGGNHELAATVSDDFDLICRRALLGVEEPFIAALQQAYDGQQIPH